MRSFVVFLVLCSAASAADRIAMVDNSASTSIKDVVKGLVRAFDEEDLDSYESCFKGSRRPIIRRKAAHLFADEDCSMELVDIHIIEDDGESASAAVKYNMGGSSMSVVILAEVTFVKEDGEWRIDRETVKSKSLAPRSMSPSIAVVAPLIPAGRPPAWDPMKPDPDRISPELNHLMGDIGIREGVGCDGGGCANGRCPVR